MGEKIIDLKQIYWTEIGFGDGWELYFTARVSEEQEQGIADIYSIQI